MFQCIRIKCIINFLQTDCYKLIVIPFQFFLHNFPNNIRSISSNVFHFLLVISLIKLFYSLQEPQLNVVIGWCRSGWVWCSAISFYDVFLEFLGRCWCQLGHVDSESHFFPLSFDIISWFKVQTAEFTSHCLSFSHLFEWSPSLWLATSFLFFYLQTFLPNFQS